MKALSLLLSVFLLATPSNASANPDTVMDRQADFKTDRAKHAMKRVPSAQFCYSGSNVKVVDTSSPVTNEFIDKQKTFGVEVVARYYGYTSTSRPPDNSKVSAWQSAKVISKSEANLLKSKKIYSIAVFQYQSSMEKTFANWKTRAPADGARAVEMAKELAQPKYSAIYFGADGDFVNNTKRKCKRVGDRVGNCTEEVKSYFTVVAKLTRAAGYRVGVYGSGATCKLLSDAGLVDMCWLNFSVGHNGREWGFASSKTVLRQLGEAGVGSPQKKKEEISLCGRPIDFNEIWQKDFGQFSY